MTYLQILAVAMRARKNHFFARVNCVRPGEVTRNGTYIEQRRKTKRHPYQAAVSLAWKKSNNEKRLHTLAK